MTDMGHRLKSNYPVRPSTCRKVLNASEAEPTPKPVDSITQREDDGGGRRAQIGKGTFNSQSQKLAKNINLKKMHDFVEPHITEAAEGIAEEEAAGWHDLLRVFQKTHNNFTK